MQNPITEGCSGTRHLAVDPLGSYSAAMATRMLVIGLFIALILVEASLFMVGSAAPLSTIKSGVLLVFLFGCPALLVGGLLVIRQPWIALVAVMYSTVALALDLATIIQEASQAAPRTAVLTLTLASSLLNFLIMIFGVRCALTVESDEKPPEDRRPNLPFPASF
jgi:hypothetical protein